MISTEIFLTWYSFFQTPCEYVLTADIPLFRTIPQSL